MPEFRTHRSNEGRLYLHVRPSKSCVLAMRALEMMIAVGFISLLLYSAFHKGWWFNITSPLVVGIIATTFTILIGMHAIVGEAKGSYEGFFSTQNTLIMDGVSFAAWVATFITMCLGKGKDYKHLFDTPPYTAWVCSLVLVIFEICTFFVSFAVLWGSTTSSR